MEFFPHPNTPGVQYTHVNNYIASPNIGKYGYNSWYSKFDYSWNQNHRSSGSVSQNWGNEYRAGNGIQNSPAKSGNDPLRRVNYGSTFDHVWAASPTTVVNVRAAWQRYINYSAQEEADKFDGSKLGWRNPIGSAPEIHFPQISYSGYLTMATGGYSANRIFWPDQAYTLSGSVSKTMNRHLFKFGAMIVETRRTATPRGGPTATSASTQRSRGAIRSNRTPLRATASRRFFSAIRREATRIATRNRARSSGPTVFTRRTT